MSMGGAAGQFRDEFRELYQAAGEPTLASLVRLSRQQHPPAQISDTTLSDWLAGKSVPGRQSSRVFLALVAVLQARAKSGQAYMPRSDWWWQRLLAYAQDERSAAQKSGRPPRPDVPERTPARPGKETPQPALRSVYLEQVRRIAPLVLSGREGELAALAEFCLEPSRGPYVWWQAGPWAGKSALLSSFVLSPPSEVSERVRFVAFFITARLASQDTRQAFIDFVLEQLAALTGEALPAVLPEATREAYLLALLEQGARSLEETGKRLVLVVDGLDEDRSVTTGPDAHSIAGLLPASPPAGMRVIVASRPNPPVPGDVPDWHPLRDPAVVRPLPSSPYARDVQRLGSQELKRLLRGSAPEQDLLGLITAARGGLSARDLASLAKIPLWEAEEILHTTAGRTFARRPARWDPASGPEVYLLGHEELQATAVRYLDDRLLAYMDRLHVWNGAYRDKDWPGDTPEYLLGGYFALLAGLGDVPRMTECSTDPARHDRMLAVTGGDAVALAEIRAALDLTAAQHHPDLKGALALAYCRDRLTERNAAIPMQLPVVWATLGHPARAEALATSLGDAGERAQALTEVVVALAQAGQPEQAKALAYAIDDVDLQSQALAQVVRALVRASQYEQAAVVARSIAGSNVGRDMGLEEAARALAQAGQYEQAAVVARSVADSIFRGNPALEAVVESLAQDRQYERAESLARSQEDEWALMKLAVALVRAGEYERAETLTRSITGGLQAQALIEVAGALVQAGQLVQGEALASQAEAAVRVTDSRLRPKALAVLTEALARADQPDQAEAMADSITDPFAKADALVEVARALVRAGQYDRAEAMAHSFPGWEIQPLTEIAVMLARAGQREKSDALVAHGLAEYRSYIDVHVPGRGLTVMARTLAQAGQHEMAESLVRSATDFEAPTLVLGLVQAGCQWLAETVARSIADPGQRLHALGIVVRLLAWVGQHEKAVTLAAQAETEARSIASPEALAEGARALAAAGQVEQAETLAEQCEAEARFVTHPDPDGQALAEVAGALARAGQREHAEAVVRSITDPGNRALALAEVAGGLASVGQCEQAEKFAGQAEAVARSMIDHDEQEREFEQDQDLQGWSLRYERDDALRLVVGALARAGQYEQAEAIARSVPDDYMKARALREVATALARAGRFEQGEVVARSIFDTGEEAEDENRSITEGDEQAGALKEVARALARAGQKEKAVAVAAEAEVLSRSSDSFGAPALARAETAGALAQTGQLEKAEAVARSTTVPGALGLGLALVAGELARAGQQEKADSFSREAQEAAGSYSSDEIRGQALAEVAEVLARAGLHNQAEAVVRSITDPWWQIYALRRTAETLVKAGISGTARRLTATVCSVAPWPAAACSVLLLDSNAFTEQSHLLFSEGYSGGQSVTRL